MPTSDDLAALLTADGHVRLDLHWLLTAAIEFERLFDDSGALTVVLQDSALSRGRALLEFACFPHHVDYFRLADLREAGAIRPVVSVPWEAWLNFINAQLLHVGHRRNPGVAWPHGLDYDSRDRLTRLADDVVTIFEANIATIRGGALSDSFAETTAWARDRLARRAAPSSIL